MATIINPFIFASTGFTDSFNRVDDATGLGTADSGQTWTNLAGTFGINGNKARLEVPGAGNMSLAVIDFGVLPSLVTAKMAVQSATGGGFGIVSQLSDIDNFYLAWWATSTTDLYLFRNVAGSFTQLGIASTSGIVAGDTLGISVVGTAVKLLLNGAQKISVIDGAVPAATKCGLRTGETGTPSAGRWDDFTAMP